MITIVGLGPSGISDLSVGAYRVIRNAPTVFVRTARHPAVDELIAEGVSFQSMDYIYESADTFEEVYASIAERVLDAATRGDVVYAVPGHPLVGETSVRILLDRAKQQSLDARVIGSKSFIEATLEALGVSFDVGLKIVDALSMDRVAPSQDVANLIYQVYDREIASDVKLRLMDGYPDDFPVVVASGAGSASQKIYHIPLYELDRHDWDHLTTVYLPALGDEPENRNLHV
jgi:tetrapyrrole methylase family protein/MazG family protein